LRVSQYHVSQKGRHPESHGRKHECFPYSFGELYPAQKSVRQFRSVFLSAKA
jgi:hypothetical protein